MAPSEQIVSPPPTDALGKLRNLVAADMEEVNRLIIEFMQSPVPLIPELATYIVASGGKRLRPLLTLGAARMCGYQGTDHCRLAAAVEFIHTATLLHDDVVDESDLRRGNPTANSVWGNQASVLVGDFLFSRSFQLMVGAGSLEVLEILSDASATIAAGEVLQLTTAGEPDTSVDAYMDVINGKTAALFAAAAQVGAVVAGRSSKEALALKTFGTELGIAFQLVDDRLDYDADQAKLGKSVGDDFREGKVTLPVIIAYQNGDPNEQAFWQRTIGGGEASDMDLEQAQSLLAKYDALAETSLQAMKHADNAVNAISCFPDSIYRQALADVAHFSVARSF